MHFTDIGFLRIFRTSKQHAMFLAKELDSQYACRLHGHPLHNCIELDAHGQKKYCRPTSAFIALGPLRRGETLLGIDSCFHYFCPTVVEICRQVE